MRNVGMQPNSSVASPRLQEEEELSVPTRPAFSVKRVRISETAPEICLAKDDGRSEQECEESWWSSTEFATAKASAKRICRHHRRERRYSDCLSSAYDTACAIAKIHDKSGVCGQRKCWEDSVKEIQETCSTPAEGLKVWLENNGPRGLEGYSSSMHAMRRQRHLHDTKHAVFIEQARQIIANEYNADLIAKQSESSSRRARTFAALLGHADAWEAKKHGNGSRPEAKT